MPKRKQNSSKPVNIRMSQDLYEWVHGTAQREDRSVAGFIKVVLRKVKEGVLK